MVKAYSNVVESLPQVVRIEPASVCNLKCLHCPTGILKDKSRGIMSPETFKIALEECRILKPRVVVLYHGGEPFLNKNIVTMVRELKSLGISFVKTVTNGMLLNEAMLPEVIKSGLDAIEFSLDGRSAEENDQLRIGSSYQHIVSRIKQLVELKYKLGSDTPQIFVANCQIPTQLEAEQKKPEVPNHLIAEFCQYPSSDVQFKVCYAIPWPGLPLTTSLYHLGKPLIRGQSLNYCEHAWELITIRHNGDIVPCCYDTTSMNVLGNINESPITEIWNNDRYKTLRRSIHNKEYLPLCQACHVVRPQQYLIRAE